MPILSVSEGVRGSVSKIIVMFKINELYLIFRKKHAKLGQQFRPVEEICLRKNYLPHWQ